MLRVWFFYFSKNIIMNSFPFCSEKLIYISWNSHSSAEKTYFSWFIKLERSNHSGLRLQLAKVYGSFYDPNLRRNQEGVFGKLCRRVQEGTSCAISKTPPTALMDWRLNSTLPAIAMAPWRLHGFSATPPQSSGFIAPFLSTTRTGPGPMCMDVSTGYNLNARPRASKCLDAAAKR
jgi:hypothetical protein